LPEPNLWDKMVSWINPHAIAAPAPKVHEQEVETDAHAHHACSTRSSYSAASVNFSLVGEATEDGTEEGTVTARTAIPNPNPDPKPSSIPLPLHPTPYTLHPTPYTLHPTPYTYP
jgi:hypothetical protein